MSARFLLAASFVATACLGGCDSNAQGASEPVAAVEKKGARVFVIQAHTWRPSLFAPRDRKSGEIAKASADRYARELIEASGLKRPTSLRHDAAEAICIGVWACIELGWRPTPPEP